MKKNVLALSIAAMIGGFAGSASAAMSPVTATEFVQSEGGSGHILLVPYYTAQNGNATVVHVVNTDTVNGKALKVRFRGAANSDDVLDFTVFLSPGDVWTGSVSADGEGARFQTADLSCVYPVEAKNQLLLADRLKDSTDVAGTKEGYIEILNMADIVGTVGDKKMFGATKHAAGGKAPSCDDTVLSQTLALDPTKTTEASALGFDVPSGQLTGDWYIINVAETNTFSGAATAIKAVVDSTTRANGTGQFVLFPQDGSQSAAARTPDLYTADPVLKTKEVYDAKDVLVSDLPIQTAVNYDFPDLSTPYLSGNTDPAVQASALTAAVANNSVSNQYMLDKSISAKTDWVLSMPTRRYSVGANYELKSTDAAYRVFNKAVTVDGTPAGTRFFSGSSTSVDANGNICVTTSSNTFYDREEQSVKNGAVVSPGQVKVISLCGEVNVLSLNGSNASVLGAKIAATSTVPAYDNGWGIVNYKSGASLPVMGASFMSANNPSSKAGVSGNYGVTWPHRFAK